jgi:hypothetical protein
VFPRFPSDSGRGARVNCASPRPAVVLRHMRSHPQIARSAVPLTWVSMLMDRSCTVFSSDVRPGAGLGAGTSVKTSPPAQSVASWRKLPFRRVGPRHGAEHSGGGRGFAGYGSQDWVDPPAQRRANGFRPARLLESAGLTGRSGTETHLAAAPCCPRQSPGLFLSP